MKIVSATVFVGVYGTLRPHPWVEPDVLGEDAYSLFAARAEAMGWSTAAGPAPAEPRWGMNDAGQDWRVDAGRVAWWQVGTSEEPSVPLPVQPLLACARDTLRRVGELELAAVQLLLPMHTAGPAGAHLAAGLGWFATSDPAARTPVLVTLDAGEADPNPTAGIIDVLQRIPTGPFRVDGRADAGPTPQPAVVDDLWLGAAREPVTVACSVPEWTFDALGWLVSLFAEGCRRAGVRTTVLVSVAPSDR